MKLTAIQCARWLDVTPETITRWCRSGHIDAIQEDRFCSWSIEIEAFADFLYRNPYFLSVYKNINFHGIAAQIQAQILKDIGQRPEVLTLYDLAEQFSITPQAVQYFVKRGKIKPYAKTTARTPLFTIESIREMVANDSRLERKLRKFYTLYNRSEVKKYLA